MDILDSHPAGRAAAVRLLVDQELRAAELKAKHHPLPLTIAIQYWTGDEDAAMRLAHLIADLEPAPRSDVLIIFARRTGTERTTLFETTKMKCSEKFPVSEIEVSFTGKKGHPDGCYALWAGTMDRLVGDWRLGNHHCTNIMTVEADGIPTTPDWIDRIKAGHAENLRNFKRVTGHTVQSPEPHVNGTLVMHASAWTDHASLHHCPRNKAWDIHHGQVLMSEAGLNVPIQNVYGFEDISYPVFCNFAREYAWLSNIKDDSGVHCLLTLMNEILVRGLVGHAATESAKR
jgi:hypothetical protein